MNIVVQVHFAKFHVDVVKIIWCTESTVPEDINYIWIPTIFIDCPFEIFDCLYFILDILMRKSSKRSKDFPSKVLRINAIHQRRYPLFLIVDDLAVS